jgi:hypothetical protein
MRRTCAAILAFALLALPLAAGAAPGDEYNLLRSIPSGVLDTLTRSDYPDAYGAMQINRNGWHNVVYQRAAIPLIWAGAAENDPQKVDAGWKAIDLALQHVQSDGGYDAYGQPMNPANMAFWVEAVSHAVVVLQQSPLGPRYQRRIARLIPVLRQNVNWLLAGDRIAWLQRHDAGGTNRLFVDANAFAFASQLLGDPSLRRIGAQFARQAQANQTADGTLLESRGFDSNYQAVSLLHGSYYALNFANPPMTQTLQIGVQRELQSIRPNGTIDVSQNTRTGRGQETAFGRPKMVSGTTVALSLYYTGYLLNDRAALDAAGRVFATLR